MERYYKNRRRCNISSRRLNYLFFRYLFWGLFFVFFCSNIILFFISQRMDVILRQYIDVEAERLINNVINKAISERVATRNYGKLYTYDDKNIIYDTNTINSMKEDINEYVQNILLKLDNGSIDKYFMSTRLYSGRFKNIKKGIVCDVSIGSIKGSTIFANMGPTIPIRLVFNSQLNSDIDVHVKEYGINNIMVKVYLIVKIKEQIIMPLNSKRKTITIRVPISMDIIKGDVPRYYQKPFR